VKHLQYQFCLAILKQGSISLHALSPQLQCHFGQLPQLYFMVVRGTLCSMLSLLMAVGVSLSRSEKYDPSCFLVSNLWYAWSYCWISQKTKKQTNFSCMFNPVDQPTSLLKLLNICFNYF